MNIHVTYEDVCLRRVCVEEESECVGEFHLAQVLPDTPEEKKQGC